DFGDGGRIIIAIHMKNRIIVRPYHRDGQRRIVKSAIPIADFVGKGDNSGFAYSQVIEIRAWLKCVTAVGPEYKGAATLASVRIDTWNRRACGYSFATIIRDFNHRQRIAIRVGILA